MGPISWEVFRKAFLDRFFLREKIEEKVEKFINLCHQSMSVIEYSLKFTKSSQYASSLVSNPRVEVNHFVTKVFDDLVEECHSAMLDHNINISCLILHDQHV